VSEQDKNVQQNPESMVRAAMIVTADGKTASKSVEGKVPTEYQIDGAMVSVSFQKKRKKENLK